MRTHLLLALLSFFVVLDVRRPDALQRNLDRGCEAFSVWENAQREPRYWMLHCPDEALTTAESNGTWLPTAQQR